MIYVDDLIVGDLVQFTTIIDLWNFPEGGEYRRQDSGSVALVVDTFSQGAALDWVVLTDEGTLQYMRPGDDTDHAIILR